MVSKFIEKYGCKFGLKIKDKLFFGFISLIAFGLIASLIIGPRILSENMEMEINDRLEDILNVTGNVLEETKNQVIMFADLVARAQDVRQGMSWYDGDDIFGRILFLKNILSTQLWSTQAARPNMAVTHFGFELIPPQGYLGNGETVRVATLGQDYKYLDKKFILDLQEFIDDDTVSRQVEIVSNNGYLSILALSPIDQLARGTTDVLTSRTAGIVAVTAPIDNAFVESLQKKISVDIHFTIYEIDRKHGNANAIATTVKGEDPKSKNLSQSIVKQVLTLSDSEKIYFSNKQIKHKPYRLAYSILREGVEPVGLLEIAIPTEKIVEATIKTKQKIYLMAGFGMCLAMVVILWIMRSINVPLAELVSATEKVVGGNFDVRASIQARDELGHLADKFNWMIDQLLGKHHEIQTAYDQLEGALQTLSTTQEKLIQSERLAAIGEATARLVHEIKNPLTSIKGFAELLTKTLKDEASREYAEIISEQIERLQALLYKVLFFTKERMLDMRRINVNEIIEEIITFLDQEMFNAKVKGDVRLCASLPRIQGDPEMLWLIFMNLVENAIQAMENGGTLTVTSGVNDNYAEVRIADTGKGIAPGNLEKVFQPFFSTKPKGIGLGLANVKKMLDAHDATIEVESKEGYGTEFCVKFPLKEVGIEE